MAELAEEAYELLSTSGSRWHTLQADGREWRNTVLVSEAWQAQLDRKRAEGQNFSVISSRSTTPRPDEIEERWRIWIAGAWKRAIFAAGQSEVDVVFHGSTWWSNGQGISTTNGGSLNLGHGEGPGEHLVSTADYPPLIEIHDVTTGTRLGRRTLEARASIRHGLPRPRGRGVHGLVIGDAADVLLSIDRERGLILYAGSWFRGSIYRVLEMSDVSFDEELSPDSFETVPIHGLDWTNLRENPAD